MELIKILSAGFSPVSLDGYTVVSHELDSDYGTIRLNLIDGTSRHIAYSMDHKMIPIEFVMHVSFNEDIASSMLMSGIAPVLHDQIDKDFARKVASMHHEHERKKRNSFRVHDLF